MSTLKPYNVLRDTIPTKEQRYFDLLFIGSLSVLCERNIKNSWYKALKTAYKAYKRFYPIRG